MRPADLTAHEAAALIAARRLSAEELIRSCLEQIAARDSLIQAFVSIDPEGALKQARALDRMKHRSPLHGLPVGIKDVIETCDLPTSYGSPSDMSAQAGLDAAAVSMLRSVGAIILGKTHTVEFSGAGRIPPTRNPHNTAHTPGGSSSGSAAAVAARMVPLALGTQTGGSLIRPASFNGVYAMKPTHGSISVHGTRPFAPSLDTIGWFGRSVADLMMMAEVFGLVRCDATKGRTPEAVIGICRGPHWDKAHRGAQDMLLGTAERLSHAGVDVRDISLPEPLLRLTSVQETIMYGEGRISLADVSARVPNELHPGVRKIVQNERRIGQEMLRDALDHAATCRPIFDGLFGSRLTALLTLAAPGEAPETLEATGDSIFNKMWSVLHAPCIAIPAGRGGKHLPVGLQLVGPRYGDFRLLKISELIAPIIDVA